MFVHFDSRQGRNLLVNMKDIRFVLQKVFFVNFISGELKVMLWWKMTSVRFTEK